MAKKKEKDNTDYTRDFSYGTPVYYNGNYYPTTIFPVEDGRGIARNRTVFAAGNGYYSMDGKEARPVMLQYNVPEVTVTSPRLNRPLTSSISDDYILSNDNTKVNDSPHREYNPHLKEKFLRGARMNAIWEKEHPNLAAWSYALSALPFAVAAYPFAAGIGSMAANTALGAAAAEGLGTLGAAMSTPVGAAVNTGLSAYLGYEGLKDIQNGKFTPGTALDLAPLAQMFKPLTRGVKSGYNALTKMGNQAAEELRLVPAGERTIAADGRTAIDDFLDRVSAAPETEAQAARRIAAIRNANREIAINEAARSSGPRSLAQDSEDMAGIIADSRRTDAARLERETRGSGINDDYVRAYNEANAQRYGEETDINYVRDLDEANAQRYGEEADEWQRHRALADPETWGTPSLTANDIAEVQAAQRRAEASAPLLENSSEAALPRPAIAPAVAEPSVAESANAIDSNAADLVSDSTSTAEPSISIFDPGEPGTEYYYLNNHNKKSKTHAASGNLVLRSRDLTKGEKPYTEEELKLLVNENGTLKDEVLFDDNAIVKTGSHGRWYYPSPGEKRVLRMHLDYTPGELTHIGADNPTGRSGKLIFTSHGDTSLDSTPLAYMMAIKQGKRFLPLKQIDFWGTTPFVERVESNNFGYNGIFNEDRATADRARALFARNPNALVKLLKDADGNMTAFQLTDENGTFLIPLKSRQEILDRMNKRLHKFNEHYGTSYGDVKPKDPNKPWSFGETFDLPNIFGIAYKKGGKLRRKRGLTF